jgi:hypothetical protein
MGNDLKYFSNYQIQTYLQLAVKPKGAFRLVFHFPVHTTLWVAMFVGNRIQDSLRLSAGRGGRRMSTSQFFHHLTLRYQS